jgi:hypothetical protein
LTVAAETLLLTHTPPVVVLERVVVVLAQSVKVPAIDGTIGKGLTVTVTDTTVEQPKPLVTV